MRALLKLALMSVVIAYLMTAGIQSQSPQTFIPELVTDINTSNGGSVPGAYVTAGSFAYFVAEDLQHGRELWRTDGTAAGTTLVKDVRSGGGTSSPANLTNVNGTLFFTANDTPTGVELWRSDGTAAGTVLVKDIFAGATSGSPALLTNVNGTLFFTANDGITGTEVWKSDGTAAGTVLLKDIRTGTTTSSPGSLTNVNGTLYFRATTSTNGSELWKSDGTTAGTVLVKDIVATTGSSTPNLLTNVNGVLMFVANTSAAGTELWKSDGTSAGTVLVKDIFPGTSSSSIGSMTAVNSTLFFRANDSTNGLELWKSDGTTAGTMMVKDIWAGTGSSGPNLLTNVAGTLFFTANNSTNGLELWKSDGTSTGTALVKDIVSGSGSSGPNSLAVVNGTLYFSATEGLAGNELWKSDGTGTGTTMVLDIVPGTASSGPNVLSAFGNRLLFAADIAANGREPWISDGTAASTSLLLDIGDVTENSSPRLLAVSNGKLFFAAFDDAVGEELRVSDGTAAGTTLLSDIRPGVSSSSLGGFVDVGGTLFFAANNGTSGSELWKSDGTPGGTVLVKDIEPGGSSSNPTSLTNVNGTLFFQAFTSANGNELWKSDGTTAGTQLVSDIFPGASASTPTSLTNVNGVLYFVANNGTSGLELWKSNGTTAGTVLVKDIEAGTGSSSPFSLLNVGGTLYFSATETATGNELWKSNGTSAGTVLVKDISPGTSSSSVASLAAVGNVVFFRASDGPTGLELWKSDGTSAGTVIVKDIVAGGSSSSPNNLRVVGNTVFFSATEAATGNELWKSDGTAAGTVLVKDLNAGTVSSSPGLLTNVNDTLLFRASTTTLGSEPWISDGTAAGTVVFDISAGNNSSTPDLFTTLNDTPLFVATDRAHGRELWRMRSGINNLPDADAGPDQVVNAVDAFTTITLDASASSDADDDPLTFEWQDTLGTVLGSDAIISLDLAVGSYVFTAVVNDGYGGTASDTVTVVIFDTTPPEITITTPASTNYALGQVVNASFSCDDAASSVQSCVGTVANGQTINTSTAGAKTFTVTASDTAGNSSSAVVNYTVGQSTPIITWPTPASIVYGTPLSATQLNASANVAGTFTYQAPGVLNALLAAGTHTLSVAFVPQDTANYTNASAQVTLEVLPATPTVTVTGGSFTFDGQPHPATATVTGIGSIVLTAGQGNVSFSYTLGGNPSGTPVAPGSYLASASFASTDSNYANAVSSSPATIAIGQATAIVSLTNLAHTYDGTPKAATVSTTPPGLLVSVTYDGAVTAPTNHQAGGYAVVATINDTNYSGTASGVLTIAKATSVTTVTVAGGASFTYDGNPHPASVTVTGAGGLNLTPAPLYSCAHVPQSVADSGCVASYTFAGDNNHDTSTGSITYTITPAAASVTLTGLSHTYDGNPKAATVTTTPPGLSVSLTYDGSAAMPTDYKAGGYAVVAAITDANYSGSSSGTLTIAKAASVTSVTVPGGASFTYDGNPHPASVTVTGAGGLNLTPAAVYSCGHVPQNVADSGCIASYTFAGDNNHDTSTGSIAYTITPAAATVSITGLSHMYDGNPKAATVTTTPPSLSVSLTYDGSTTAPTDYKAGGYAVIATITDGNYTGSATGTLTIAKATSVTTVTVPGGASFTYDGNPHPASVTVTGAGGLNLTPAAVYSCGHAPQNVADSGCVASYTFASDNNHDGSTGSITYAIAPAVATITITGLSHTYDGTPKSATVTTTPLNLSVSVTYDGAAAAPSDFKAGGYAVAAAVTDPNYTGSATGTLTIAKATSVTTVTVPGGASFTYDGNPHPASVTVTGAGGLNLTPAAVYSCGHAAQNVADSGCVASYTFAGDTNHDGSTGSITYAIAPAAATLTLTALSHTYDGTPKAAAVSTTPINLSVSVTYDGAAAAPTDYKAGGYAVIATITDGNYTGSTTGTLTIAKATSVTSVTVPGGASFTYDGNPHPASVTVIGAGGLNLTPAAVYSCGHAPQNVADSGCVASYVFAGDNNHVGSNDAATYSITAASATVTLTALAHTYDGTPKTAIASTVPAGLGITLTYDNSASAPTNHKADGYAVVATITDGNHNGSANDVLTIAKAASSTAVSVAGGASFVFDANPHPATVAVTGPGGLNLTPAAVYSCGHAPQAVADSGCSASYTFAGDNNHEGSADAVTYSVTRATATVSLTALSHTYDGTPKSTIAATTPDGLTVSVTYDGAATAPTDHKAAGYAVAATLTNPNYQADIAHATLTIAKAALVVTPGNHNKVYGDTFTAFTGALATVAAGDNITATYSSAGSAVSAVVGPHTISATLVDPGNRASNYAVALNTGTLTVTQANLAVATDNKSREYGVGNPTLTGTITGIKNGDPVTAQFATPAISSSPIGSYPIAATLNDPAGRLSNYTVSNPGGTLTVGKATLTIIADVKERPFGDANPTFTGGYSGQQNGDEFVLSFSTSATAASAVGTYSIVPSASGSALGNYIVVVQNGTLTVRAWSAAGFHQPVGVPNSIVTAPGLPLPPTSTLWNTLSGGQTVPLKFNLYKASGGTELTSVSNVAGFALVDVPCTTGTEDPADFTTTGNTSLSYDGTQFIQNWQSPKVRNRCYRVTMAAQDGTRVTAFFKTK